MLRPCAVHNRAHFQAENRQNTAAKWVAFQPTKKRINSINFNWNTSQSGASISRKRRFRSVILYDWTFVDIMPICFGFIFFPSLYSQCMSLLRLLETRCQLTIEMRNRKSIYAWCSVASCKDGTIANAFQCIRETKEEKKNRSDANRSIAVLKIAHEFEFGMSHNEWSTV